MTDTAVAPLNLGRLYSDFEDELVAAFREVLRGGQYILGMPVEGLEERLCDYVGCRHAVGCKSGTHALILALKAAGIGPGDRVITVANTYYATARAIRHVGADPVFVDVDPDIGSMDAALAEAVIDNRTRAILVVHLYGYVGPLETLRTLCARRGLVLIEDCAHAFGTRVGGHLVGQDSQFACFSFYPTKTLGAMGDGGAVLCGSEVDAQRMRALRYYACDDRRIEYDPQAEHARMDSLQAQVLSTLLRHVPQWSAVRNSYAQRYRARLGDLPGLRIPKPPVGQEPVLYSFPVFCQYRDAVVRHLCSRAVPVQIHYQTDLHRLPEFCSGSPASLPVTERHNREVLNLPLHPSLTLEEVDAVCDEFIASWGIADGC